MKLTTIIATAAATAVLATAGVSIAGAAGSGPAAPATTTSTQPAATPFTTDGPAASPATAGPARADVRARRARRRARLRRLLHGAASVVADTIGIDRPTLRHDLRAGQTIAEIATAHGVDPQQVVDALVQAATTRLDAAVAAGRIGSDRAQRIEQRLPARITRIVDSWHPRQRRAGR